MGRITEIHEGIARRAAAAEAEAPLAVWTVFFNVTGPDTDSVATLDVAARSAWHAIDQAVPAAAAIVGRAPFTWEPTGQAILADHWLNS